MCFLRLFYDVHWNATETSMQFMFCFMICIEPWQRNVSVLCFCYDFDCRSTDKNCLLCVFLCFVMKHERNEYASCCLFNHSHRTIAEMNLLLWLFYALDWPMTENPVYAIPILCIWTRQKRLCFFTFYVWFSLPRNSTELVFYVFICFRHLGRAAASFPNR